jgi:hypothetical protein
VASAKLSLSCVPTPSAQQIRVHRKFETPWSGGLTVLGIGGFDTTTDDGVGYGRRDRHCASLVRRGVVGSPGSRVFGDDLLVLRGPDVEVGGLPLRRLGRRWRSFGARNNPWRAGERATSGARSSPPYVARCSRTSFLEERGVLLTALDIVLGAISYPNISKKQTPNRANGPLSLPPALRS